MSRYNGPVNGLPVLRSDVRARVGADGPEAVYLHMVAEGARIALGELGRMGEIEGKGRGVAASHDRRSRLGDMLDGLLRTPVVTARRLAESLGVTPQTATAALRVLRPAGLVREVTGRELPGLQPGGLRLEMGEGRGARRFHSRLSARCGLSVRLRLRDCGSGLAQDDAPFADSDEGFRVSGHG